MIRRPPRSTRTDTLFPYTTLFRSVSFGSTGVTVPWDDACPSLLDLAEQAGLSPDFNCRSGLCNTCMSTLVRSEEHTSELQSLMRISYAVFCLKKKKQHINYHN